MAIVRCHDKRSGITYAYESISYWDKEKKQARSHRILIGRIDKVTGQIVPTDGRCRKRSLVAGSVPVSSGSLSVPPQEINKKKRMIPVDAQRKYCGATYLLDRIGEETGVAEDLRECFPENYKEILSLAYYLIMEDRSPLYRFSKWDRQHKHPFGRDIASQRSSELFQSISEADRLKFFRLQAQRCAEDEYLAYDTTSVSSYSELIRQVKYGKNKDGDSLPQINLALLFGEKSRLPLYYKKLPGNITDVKTVNNLLKELKLMGYGKTKLVLDRGFYSTENINYLYQNSCKFVCGVSTSLRYVKEYIREIGSAKERYSNYNSGYGIYAFSKTLDWTYVQKRPRYGDSVTKTKKLYLHLYYDPVRQVNDTAAFNNRLSVLGEEITQKRRNPAHEKDYDKYFEIREGKNGITITPKDDAIAGAKERFGFFALISNDIKAPIEALQIYRGRDVVEKGYENIKDRLDCGRLKVSSETSLDGKLFVVFIAQIFLAFVKKKMEDAGLYGKYTLHKVFDELDTIESFSVSGEKTIIGEITKKQEQLYIDLGVKPLSANGV